MNHDNPRVRPGEVISSNLINQILERLEALEQGSSAGNGPRINSFNPPNEQAIGRTLEIFGANFSLPITQNIITLDGVQITNFEPSQADLLRFVVPFIPGAPRNVTVRIENALGATSSNYRVVPAVPVTGPPPLIQTATRPNGNARLQVGQPFILSGENFGATVAANRLSISSRVAGFANEVYRVTNITSAAPDRIEAVLPSSIVIHNAILNFDPMLLRLSVGAHDEVTFDVFVDA